MIFITIGFQLPFDRLIKTVDELAPELGDDSIFAQIGQSKYQPLNINKLEFVSPLDFKNYMSRADLIIGHAGMGTILSALELEKPIVVMPRRKQLGEHTTDHQLATARQLDHLGYVRVAYNEEDLGEMLRDGDFKREGKSRKISQYASDALVESIEEFIGS